MAIDSVEALLAALEDTQLLSSEHLETCRRDRATFADPKALARHLLQRDWLTPYQVNNLLQGKIGELVIGRYILLERLGQGGMGQVFKAWDNTMSRVVALKVIRKERLGNAELLKRFRREIQMAAQLSHSNIVIAYDAQLTGEPHYLVMEYVEGIDLARFVEKNGKRPVAQACDFIRQAALGLQHAHEKGLVHRDIKPANLLLAVRENTVKVLDMGLARLSQGSDADATAAGLTQEGTVMGTPDYMAPEQAEDTTTVDTRADIYSLGCTLYFLLAGSVPFAGGTLAQKLRKHAQAEPPPLAGVPAGLEAVIRKMMAKRPEDRYQVPGEAAAALAPFCRSGPVAAIPMAAPASRPVAVPLSDETLAAPPRAAVAVALPAAVPVQGGGETVPPSVLDSVASVTAAKRPRPIQRAREVWQGLGRRGQIAAGAGAAVALLAFVLLVWPRHAAPPPPTDEPVGLFKLDPKQVPSVERRAWMPKEFKDLLVAVLGEHRARMQGLSCFALRPDGKKLAFGGPLLFLVDAETLHRYDDVKTMTGHNGGVYSLAFSGDGKLLVTGGGDRTVRLWDGETGASLGAFDGQHDGVVRAVAITPAGGRVISGGDDKVVRVWDVASRKQVAVYKGHISAIRALAVTADGSRAFSLGSGTEAGQLADNDVQMWDLKTVPEKPERQFKGHTAQLTQLAVSPDGQQLVAAGNKPDVWVWDLSAPETPTALTTDQVAGASAGAAFLPDGRLVTEGTGTGSIKVWKRPDETRNAWVEDSSYPRTVTLQNSPALVAYPDKRRVAFMEGTTVRVWDIDKKEEWRPPLGHEAAVTHLAFAGDRWLLSGGTERWLHLWDLETGQQQGEAFGFPPLSNEVYTGIGLSPDSLHAFNGTGTNVVRMWETRPPYRNLRTFVVEPKETLLHPIALSPDGKRLLAAGTGGAVWDVTSAASDLPLRTRKSEASANPVRQVGFLTDDAHPRRAWGFDGSELRIWDDIEKSETPRKLPIVGNVVAVGPNADLIYAGASGGLLQWHDLADPRARPRPSENRHDNQPANILALSPDGSTLFSAGGEHVVWWDVTPRGIEARAEWNIVGGVYALVFATDGRHLIMSTGNTTIYVLRLPEKGK